VRFLMNSLVPKRLMGSMLPCTPLLWPTRFQALIKVASPVEADDVAARLSHHLEEVRLHHWRSG